MINVTARTAWLVALATSSSFVALLTVFPFRLFVNHRWDSLCLTLLSMVLLAKAPKPKHLICSGLLMGCVVIVTPPTVFISLATATYLAFLGQSEVRVPVRTGIRCHPDFSRGIPILPALVPSHAAEFSRGHGALSAGKFRSVRFSARIHVFPVRRLRILLATATGLRYPRCCRFWLFFCSY